MVLKILEVTDVFLVVIDNFDKFGWTIPLKNKSDQTKNESFGENFLCSKRKPNTIETDCRKKHC